MRRPGALVLACLLASLLAAACGNSAEPATPPGVSGDPKPSAPASSAPDPEVAGDNPAKPRSRKPFEIHSSCPGIVTVVFGDDPKAEKAGRRTLAPNSAIDGPRDADGKQTVTVLNEKGDPIGTVHITKGMKRLEIGRSCQTVNAD
ncbi:hypothetical protein BH11MYX4_BH11MYX4_50290 [soil metagenome]